MSLLVRDRETRRAEAVLAVIDPRIEARRRDVLAARRQRRHRWMVALAVVVTVIGGSFGLTRSAALDVDSISVTAGVHTSERELRDAVGIRVGDHLVDVDLEAIHARVLALPWVKEAQVERFWKGSIALKITERTPVATIHAGSAGWFLVDADHRVLAVQPSVPADLPVVETVTTPVVGTELTAIDADATKVAQALTPGLRTRVTAVSVSRDGVIELALKPAGVARLGSAAHLEQKVISLQTVFAQVDLHDLCVVDVRVADAPVLTRGTTCA